MEPISEITQETKLKDGRTIIVKMQTFKESIGKTSEDEFFNRQTFTEKETGLTLGTMLFPKTIKSVLEKQMEVAINNIDDYLDVISQG